MLKGSGSRKREDGKREGGREGDSAGDILLLGTEIRFKG